MTEVEGHMGVEGETQMKRENEAAVRRVDPDEEVGVREGNRERRGNVAVKVEESTQVAENKRGDGAAKDDERTRVAKGGSGIRDVGAERVESDQTVEGVKERATNEGDQVGNKAKVEVEEAGSVVLEKREKKEEGLMVATAGEWLFKGGGEASAEEVEVQEVFEDGKEEREVKTSETLGVDVADINEGVTREGDPIGDQVEVIFQEADLIVLEEGEENTEGLVEATAGERLFRGGNKKEDVVLRKKNGAVVVNDKEGAANHVGKSDAGFV